MNIQIFDNATVRVDAENLVCITDIYKIAVERGLDGGKLDPRRWTEKPRAIKSGTSGKVSFTERDGYQFVEFIAKSLNAARCDIYKTTRGKGGGTYAHWQIALAYAKYLSHELHMQVNETYMRAQSGDVTLAAEIAEKQQDPKKTAWLAQRVKSIHARNVLTDTLTRHGVKTGVEFAGCTNAFYQGMFEKTAKELKEERNLPANANLRDSMDETELLAIALAENLAERKIRTTNSQGYTECKTRCLDASKIIADAVRNAL